MVKPVAQNKANAEIRLAVMNFIDSYFGCWAFRAFWEMDYTPFQGQFVPGFLKRKGWMNKKRMVLHEIDGSAS